jgi:hypothetical protein
MSKSVNSRVKGSSYENELCRLFREEFGIPSLRRRLSQTQDPLEGDIFLEPFLCEAKRYKQGNWFRPEWWVQCKAAAAKHNAIPLLCYRFDRQPTRMVFPLFAVNSAWAVEDNDQYSWPTEGDAMRPLVCDEATGLALIREWLL